MRIGAAVCGVTFRAAVQALWLCATNPGPWPDCHGKEGVAGSSPAEGFGNRATARFSCFRSGSDDPSGREGVKRRRRRALRRAFTACVASCPRSFRGSRYRRGTRPSRLLSRPLGLPLSRRYSALRQRAWDAARLTHGRTFASEKCPICDGACRQPRCARGGEWLRGRGGAGRGARVPSPISVLEPGQGRGDRMVDGEVPRRAVRPLIPSGPCRRGSSRAGNNSSGAGRGHRWRKGEAHTSGVGLIVRRPARARRRRAHAACGGRAAAACAPPRARRGWLPRAA